MKNSKLLLMTSGIVFMALAFQSCLNDDTFDDYLYPNALVTVKPVTDKSFFLQLNDSTTLYPVNVTASPYADKEVRALVNYKEVKEPSNGYSKAVYINWIDSILTKTMVPDLGSDDDATYGNDPVEIVNDWVTVLEDGYLTLRIRTVHGSQPQKHTVNLLAASDPAKPYEIEFRHNACGDVDGTFRDALVAFRLNMLPNTNGKTVKLKLKWKSFSGDKWAEFNYCTRSESTVK
ncbi:MAG TPA: NigD-like protein [Bacteroidales bacterium]|nr:NigD-like protein [Bacteroidales bacterium]